MSEYSLKPNNFIKLLLLLFIFSSCIDKNISKMNQKNDHVFRLKPGEDLKKSIQQYVDSHHIKAGWIVTCVGSLTDYQLRFSNQLQPYTGSGHFEIVSLTGTLSENGSHMHISISDSTGKTIGGHLLDGCKIYTTAEIVLHASDEFIFKRENDGSTPWNELKIETIPVKETLKPGE